MLRPSNVGSGENLSTEISPTSKNYGSKSKNDFATEIEDPEDDSMDASYPLGVWCLI